MMARADRPGFTKRHWAIAGGAVMAILLLSHMWRSSPMTPKRAGGVELPTRWSKHATGESVWREYPRPQMRRQHWMNLNGVWELQEAFSAAEPPPFGKTLAERILVPFPIESDLSGIGRYFPRMWYRRLFQVPNHWEGSNVLLHFGAVDWQCKVYVNGKEVGGHTGGYDKFSFDITESLSGGENEVVVGVYDPTNTADGVPLGKQRALPEHRLGTNIFYTSSSGIWQTVWLEPVPEAHVTRLAFVPHLDTSKVSLEVFGTKGAAGLPIQVTISEDLHGPEVAVATAKVGEKTEVTITRPKLWAPETPHLYQVEIQVMDQHMSYVVDTVAGYFGMRKVEVSADSRGKPRIKLNNRVEMQIGMLDQGFWPDGLHTAPSDEALVYDITISKEMGFNVLRKHIKVEPDRWYFHADRLGMLVWQDMPCMCGMLNTSWGNNWYPECSNAERPITEESKKQFELEMVRHIEEHISFPSIVMYVIFNEGWGQFDTERVTKKAMALDPSRIYNAASGWNDAPVGHIIDQHDYKSINPYKPTGGRASVLGEFGGLGLNIKPHSFLRGQNASSYIMYDSVHEMTTQYLEYLRRSKELMLDPVFSLSGIIYTELADVEHEVNGWLTYDRQVVKADVTLLRKHHRDLIETAWNL